MMKKMLIMILTGILMMASGCGNHAKKKSTSSKSSASPKVTESVKPTETESPSASPDVSATDSSLTSDTDSGETTPASTYNTQSDITGDYLIISYENSSGDKEEYDPGKDDSIIGSSSIVLKADGTCEFNMPGVGENTSCTWSGNTLQAAGAETPFALNGDEMTIQENGETYVFKKGK